MRHPCVLSKDRAQSICRRARMTPVLIHIPKTAGKTTRIMMDYAVKYDWRLQFFLHTLGTQYEKVVEDEVLQNQISAGCQLLHITLLRDPVDRMISEWFHFGQSFLRFEPILQLLEKNKIDIATGNVTEGMNLIFDWAREDPKQNIAPSFKFRVFRDERPGSRKAFTNDKLMWRWMEAYVSHPATMNLQTKFLLGQQLYSEANVTPEDVEVLIQRMKCHPPWDHQTEECQGKPALFAGILERFGNAIDRFQFIGMNLEYWRRKVMKEINPEDKNFRTLTGRKHRNLVPKSIIQKIQEVSSLDQALYDAAIRLDDAAKDEIDGMKAEAARERAAEKTAKATKKAEL